MRAWSKAARRSRHGCCSHWAAAWIVVALLCVFDAAKADGLGQSFRRVTGAVVVLHTSERRVAIAPSTGGAVMVTAEGLGSGVLVSEDGLVVTAAHVVQVADRVEVEFIDHQRIVADVIGASALDDVALLKLTSPVHGIRPAKWGDSDKVEIGDPVFVVGAPYGLDHTLTSGRISGRRPRGIFGASDPQGELLQTDAAINRGNSGGPLFDEKGQLIGIVSFILSESGGFEGLGFAVTSNTVHQVLIANRAVWTGMSGVLVSGEVASALQLPQPGGYVIQQVARYSPAERAGLKPGRIPAVIAGESLLLGGDIILAVDGTEVDGTVERSRVILDYLAQRPPGTSVKLRLLRDGSQQEIVSYAPR